ncbi:MAG: hypothetical protein QG553_468 [Patescibacteria group bacterium]|nr:hypothetical protein [Patescibacteria group bacterium]
MHIFPSAEITGFADEELFVAATQNHPNRTSYPHVRTPHIPALKDLLLSLQQSGCIPTTPLNRIHSVLESFPLFPGVNSNLQQWHTDQELYPGEQVYTIADARPLQWVEGSSPDLVDPHETIVSLLERDLTVVSAGRLAVVRVHPDLVHRRPPNEGTEPVPRNHALFVIGNY